MPSFTVENYLKAILQIGMRDDADLVSTGALADRLSLSPGTVTSMLKTLDESELAAYTPYEGVRLTEQGRKLAIRMLRRHRLIELFLVKTLDLSWDQVHEEAEHMEHAVSDFLVDRIDEFLGRPTADPHGDPIPAPDGTMRGEADSAVALSACEQGRSVRFVRVVNQGADFLQYLSRIGLVLGAEGVVTANEKDAGLVSAEFGDVPVSMGHSAAQNVLVEVLAEAD